MKIEYIGHACLLIDTGKIKIATDPWFYGPAYCGQWHIFPKPVNASALNQIDVIALSHGHEDHLHAPSLEQIKGDKRIFYPYLWFGGTKEYLEGMGFGKVTEAIHCKSYRVDGETTITYITNSLDSIIVLESKGKVLVNINDALHSSSADTISRILNYSFDSEWGGEALGIGYGCEIHIADRETVRAGLGQACIQLLHRLPVFKSHMRRSPLRAMRALITEKAMRRRAMAPANRSSDEAPDVVYGNHWLLESADRICETFQLPQFDVEIASQMRMKAKV